MCHFHYIYEPIEHLLQQSVWRVLYYSAELTAVLLIHIAKPERFTQWLFVVVTIEAWNDLDRNLLLPHVASFTSIFFE